MTDMYVIAKINLTREQVRAGWGRNLNELKRSIAAALYELRGDDGGAYQPRVSFPDQWPADHPGSLRHVPAPLTLAQLLDVLDDIRARVAAGDSFEGNLEYLMPYPDESHPDGYPDEVEFLVKGNYRVGNTMGQGGMRLIGSLEESPEPAGSAGPTPGEGQAVPQPTEPVDPDLDDPVVRALQEEASRGGRQVRLTIFDRGTGETTRIEADPPDQRPPLDAGLADAEFAAGALREGDKISLRSEGQYEFSRPSDGTAPWTDDDIIALGQESLKRHHPQLHEEIQDELKDGEA